MPAMKRQRQILHFNDINQSHEETGFTGRTDIPDFHTFTLEETYPSTRMAMPPYTLRFYCIMLLEEHSDDAVIELNTRRLSGPSNTISFQSPGHTSAWVRGEAQRGFIVYFQSEFLSHYSTSLFDDFPFFRQTEINVLPQ
jgi:AraC family transcriptional activator of pobA